MPGEVGGGASSGSGAPGRGARGGVSVGPRLRVEQNRPLIEGGNHPNSAAQFIGEDPSGLGRPPESAGESPQADGAHAEWAGPAFELRSPVPTVDEFFPRAAGQDVEAEEEEAQQT